MNNNVEEKFEEAFILLLQCLILKFPKEKTIRKASKILGLENSDMNRLRLLVYNYDIENQTVDKFERCLMKFVK